MVGKEQIMVELKYHSTYRLQRMQQNPRMSWVHLFIYLIRKWNFGELKTLGEFSFLDKILYVEIDNSGEDFIPSC
jgi:hypothetical protein